MIATWPQFEEVFKESENEKEKLLHLVDPAFRNECPINSIWKVHYCLLKLVVLYLVTLNQNETEFTVYCCMSTYIYIDGYTCSSLH